MEPPFRFACITGASSGIGEAFARALPATTHLLLHGRDRERLAVLEAALAAPERQVLTLASDLATEEGRAALLRAAEPLPLDLLINNAGIGAYGPWRSIAPEREREMLEVNVLAPALIARALLPAMEARARGEQRRAAMIMVSSTAAFAPLPYFATYAATKAFDYWYAEGLANEFSDAPLNILTLCPGPTRTAFFRRAGAEGLEGPGMTSPEAVARAALAALGKRAIMTVGARNQLYKAMVRLLPYALLRTLLRRGMQRGIERLVGG